MTHIKVNIRVYNLLSPLMILSTGCYKEVQNVFFFSAGTLRLQDVFARKEPKAQFSGQIYRILFSRAFSMNCACFPAHFFFFFSYFFNL